MIEDINRKHEVHLVLPGGEIDVMPKRMGFWESIRTNIQYRLVILVMDIIYPASNQFRCEVGKLRLKTFFRPPIPDELWRHGPIPTTTDIQIEKQRFWRRIGIEI